MLSTTLRTTASSIPRLDTEMPAASSPCVVQRATVDIELTDGRVLSADAQDMSGLFVENFYFVAVPTKTDGGLEMVAAVVARARDGTELARHNGAVG